jgi:hypothetical protein
MEFLYFLSGIGLGTLFGVTIMAVMQVASKEDDWMERESRKHK